MVNEQTARPSDSDPTLNRSVFAPSAARHPSCLSRSSLSVFIGAAYGLVAHGILARRGAAAFGFDFTYPWLAAKAILHGVDPYAFVRSQSTPFAPSLFYPLPAGIVAIPLAWAPVRTAACIFVGFGCAILAFVMTKRDLWRAIVFLSAPAFAVAWSVQWSPLLMGGALCPALLWVIIAKPNLALPLIAYQSTKRAFVALGIGGVIILGVSLVIEPAWPIHWINTIRSSPASGQYRVPILTSWGAPLALSALAVRHREGRLLIAMSCVPQNFFLYDQFVLFLIPESRIELMAMSAVSWFAFPIQAIGQHHQVPPERTALLSNLLAPSVVAALYYPALAIVLLRLVRTRQARMPKLERRHVRRGAADRDGDEDARR